jgi:hypothetical protein
MPGQLIASKYMGIGCCNEINRKQRERRKFISSVILSIDNIAHIGNKIASANLFQNK